jgi:murE/murF fusion protein
LKLSELIPNYLSDNITNNRHNNISDKRSQESGQSSCTTIGKLTIGNLTISGSNDPDILSIASNSLDVKPGALFIAVKGLVADGHDYIEDAFEKGAVAVVAQNNPKNIHNVILVEDSRLAMARIAANFYGNPSKELTLVGITGTNGKTTTSLILESIFKACGFSTGVIGTINIKYNGITFDNPVTTPDSIDLQKTLYKMKDCGVSHVIIEVSSHGLDLKRVDYCKFDAGIFTNLSQDHLDYHKNMAEYFECKKRFFTQFLGPDKKNNAPAIINIDDVKGEELYKSLAYKAICTSTKTQQGIFADNFTNDINGLSGTIHLPGSSFGESFNMTSSLTGTFNLENILCAAAVAHALNIDSEYIKKGINDCHIVPGRLEKVNTPINRHIFVDYAHTPDALESILITLKQMAPKRIITIFGCGGDRDRAKRPLMGQIACKHSDICIVTSDNPRTEKPETIIDDILKGLTKFDKLLDSDLSALPFKKGYLTEVDRKKAIEKAIFISKPGDIVIAAGKGHETYQITNSGTIHFDDKEELQKAALKFDEQFKPIAWNQDDIEKALEIKPAFSTLTPDQSFTGISTDSRTITKTQIFLALKGENFDGHVFIKNLIEKGIKGFIVEKDYIKQNNLETIFANKTIVVFETDNTLTSLGQLAQYQRIRSNVKLVAITGSSGKTTTRKITKEIFETTFLTHSTKGNFNNEIGLPLTLLNLSRAHEWAIVEMGMNHPGEISRLSKIALPDIAMVINTASVHLEGLGNVENVAKAKAEIFEGVRKNGTAIIFAEDPRREILEKKASENNNIQKLILFGTGRDTDFCPTHIENSNHSTQFNVRINNEEHTLKIHSPALFMVDNCLAAICAAATAGVSITGIRKGIAAFYPMSGRMNIYKIGDHLNIIDDTYNANPASVTQALKTLSSINKGKNSIAVLGDMLELGPESDMLHKKIGQAIAGLKISKLYVFGNQVKQTIQGALENGFSKDFIFHGTKKQIAQKILKDKETETWVLVKGSRGVSMEQVIHELKKPLTDNS